MSARALVAVSLAGLAMVAHTAEAQTIDLPTALRLAGAVNLDVQIARQQLKEAEAADSAAKLQFLPWLSPNATLRRHDDRIQDVAGNMLDADKHSYSVGLTAGLQVDVGDAIYRKLAAEQSVAAATHSVEAQQGDAVLRAAAGYFELVRTRAVADTVREARRISREYEEQVRRAVEIGIANRADELRVRVQTQRYEIELRRALEQQQAASARLAQVLHLDPATELQPLDETPVALALVPADASLASFVERALESRPELLRGRALTAAAEKLRSGAGVGGSLIPNFSAQAFWGGLGGGRPGLPSSFGGTADYAVLLGWRIGPGGLFDGSRTKTADARLERARLEDARLRDEVVRQVVESFNRVASTADQVTSARQNLETATLSLQLSESRREFGVAAVLEVTQAQRDLTQARADYVSALAESDKAQYELLRAVGQATPGNHP